MKRKAPALPASSDDLKLSSAIAAETMMTSLARSEAALMPLEGLLDGLGLLPEGDDVETREARINLVDEAHARLRKHLLSSGVLAEAFSTAVQPMKRGAAPPPHEFPPLTRPNATAYAAEIAEELLGHLPALDAAFPGYSEGYGDSDEEIDRCSRDSVPYERRFVELLQRSGVIEATLARAFNKDIILPAAQADGDFAKLVIEAVENVVRPYFPPAVAARVAPEIADRTCNEILLEMERRLIIACSIA